MTTTLTNAQTQRIVERKVHPMKKFIAFIISMTLILSAFSATAEGVTTGRGMGRPNGGQRFGAQQQMPGQRGQQPGGNGQQPDNGQQPGNGQQPDDRQQPRQPYNNGQPDNGQLPARPDRRQPLPRQNASANDQQNDAENPEQPADNSAPETPADDAAPETPADDAEAPAEDALPELPADARRPIDKGGVAFDEMLNSGVITQETFDAIESYMQEHAPAAPADEADPRQPEDGEAPEAMTAEGLLEELVEANVITREIADAILAATAK